MVYVVKISQLGKGANLVVDTESLVLEADNVGEYFVDTLTVSSDQTWELTDATSGILFSFIDEHQSGQITTKKVEVKVLFRLVTPAGNKSVAIISGVYSETYFGESYSRMQGLSDRRNGC